MLCTAILISLAFKFFILHLPSSGADFFDMTALRFSCRWPFNLDDKWTLDLSSRWSGGYTVKILS